MTRDQKVAWAAGFFDGEGSIAIRRIEKGESRLTFHLRINASQKIVEPLLRLQEIFGGAVLTSLGKKQARVWEMQGPRAALALTEMLPFLTVKAEQATIALAFQSREWRGKKRTSDQLAQDEADWLGIREARAVALAAASEPPPA